MNPAPDRLLDKLGLNLLLLAKVLLIVLVALVLERVIRILLKRAYLHSDQGNEDRTRYRFLRNATRFIVGLVGAAAIIYTIPSLRYLAVTLFAGAGILVALLGFAAQGAFSNIISGIFIVSFKPFRVGDMLQVGTHSGIVEDITLRHTVIVTGENRRVIIPNSRISDETLINSTVVDPAICQYVEVTVAYATDLRKAMKVLEEVCLQHEHSLDRRTPGEEAANEPVVPVRVVNLGESGVLLRAHVWAKDAFTARMMLFDLQLAIKERFDRDGIEIPYPHRTVVLRHEGRGNSHDHEAGG